MRFIVLMAVALTLVSGCHPRSARQHDVAELAAHAQTGLRVTGTLAGLGSFEWETSPLINHAADELIQVGVEYKLGQISKQLAQARADKIDEAYNLLMKGNSTCNQNPSTGKCRGNESQARALVDQARLVLTNLPES